MTRSITFRKLEPPLTKLNDSALDEWYTKIRDTPIEDLNDGDLSRACRQQLYPRHVVPISISRLEANPLAGEVFDGELLVSMKSVPNDYWHTDRQISDRLLNVINNGRQLFDDDILQDTKVIASRIKNSV